MDSWIWKTNKSGEFSTKSAYLSIIRDRTQGADRNLSKLWKTLWKLNTHQRHRILWWRLISGCFPTKSRLALRLNLQDNCCCLCNEAAEETDLHLFFNCPFAKAIWCSTSLGPYMCNNDALTITQWFWLLINLSAQSEDDASNTILLASIVLEAIWKARNEKIFQNLAPQATLVSSSCSKTFEDYWPIISSTFQITPSPLVWNTPPIGWFAITAFPHVDSSGVFAAVAIRDSNGKFTHFSCDPIQPADQIIMEADCLLAAVKIAHFMRLRYCIFESTNNYVITSIYKYPTVIDSAISCFVDSIYHWSSNIVAWIVSKVDWNHICIMTDLAIYSTTMLCGID